MKWKVCFQKVPHAATHGDRCGNAVHGSFTCVYLHHLSEWCCRNPASHCPCTDRISIKDLLFRNALVVSMPPIGLLRCNAVLEDLQTFLKQQPLLRWPYGGVHHLHAYSTFEHNGFQHGEPDGTALWQGTVSFPTTSSSTTTTTTTSTTTITTATAWRIVLIRFVQWNYDLEEHPGLVSDYDHPHL